MIYTFPSSMTILKNIFARMTTFCTRSRPGRSEIEPHRLDVFEISKVHATNATEMGGILEHIESKHVGNKALNK